jgi:hypothetical protein
LFSSLPECTLANAQKLILRHPGIIYRKQKKFSGQKKSCACLQTSISCRQRPFAVDNSPVPAGKYPVGAATVHFLVEKGSFRPEKDHG